MIDPYGDAEEEDNGGLSALPGGTLRDYQSILAARDSEEGASIDAAYAPLRKRYEDAAARLREQRLGPSSAEQLFEMSSALSKPMAYKGIGAIVGNVAPVMQGQERTKRENESSRRAALLELEGKQYEVTSEAELAKLKGRSGRQAALDKLVLTQPKMGFNPVTGQPTFTTGPMQGRPVPGAPKPGAGEETIEIDGSTFRRDLKGNLVLVPRSAAEEVALATDKKRAETAVGDAAEAAKALPKAIQSASFALKEIAALRADPNLGAVVGAPNPFKGDFGPLGALPGSPAVGVRSRIEQLAGGAFLQAFEQLKGGGQITEIEGNKATAAIARLNRAQSEKDFNAALDDLEIVIKAGATRAQQQAALLARRAATGGGADPAAFARNKPTTERPPLSSFVKD